MFDGDDIVEELKRGKILIATFYVDQGFTLYVSGIFNSAGKSDQANHAIAVVGYDDSTKSVKVANSWGVKWGEGGFARISMDAFVSRTSEIIFDRWCQINRK